MKADDWGAGTGCIPGHWLKAKAQPYAAAAVQLRRWDDQSKVVGLCTPDLSAFSPVLAEFCWQSREMEVK